MDHIDIFLKVIAQQAIDDDAANLLSVYLAFTRAMYITHQQNHWLAKNYNDHLLFQRLYEEMLEIVDSVAERTVGLCNITSFKAFNDIVDKFAPKENSIVAFLESSLEIERVFQKLAKKVYNTLKEKDMLTLGLDDLIMSQADDCETHIYLLQQAVSEYKDGPAEKIEI